MHICGKCSQLQKTCCEQAHIIITDNDIERIKNAGFHNFYENKKGIYCDDSELDDVNWRSYVLNKNDEIQVLKKNSIGSCIFLGESGCKLDMQTRPVICRLYPYYYNETEILSIIPSWCPEQLDITEKVCADEFEMSRETAENWRKQLYKELRAGKIFKENFS